MSPALVAARARFLLGYLMAKGIDTAKILNIQLNEPTFGVRYCWRDSTPNAAMPTGVPFNTPTCDDFRIE